MTTPGEGMQLGREWISELGIYDYRNRMYHPKLGRFLQTDPIGFDAGDMNLFRYCGDDPVNRSDPLGLEDIEISAELNKLGIQASVNSRNSFFKDPAAGVGSRGQVVQEIIKLTGCRFNPKLFKVKKSRFMKPKLAVGFPKR